jgi:ATP-binding protein involved in chromosome partitioning
MSIDPREYSIQMKLKDISTFIPVMSYKGGVGKTTISTLLSLCLADVGYSVGLLDLDFTNPCVHRMLGIDVKKLMPKEEKGILPVEIENIGVMSIAFFTKDNPTPLRGAELNDVFKELLSITAWGKLDFLILDMPPGLSDVSLDVLKYFKRDLYPLIVSSSSRLAIVPTINLFKLMKELKLSPIGVVINGGIGTMSVYREVTETYLREGLEVIGSIEKDEKLEEVIGSPMELRRTLAYASIKKVCFRALSTTKKVAS